MNPHFLRGTAIACMALITSGCASFSADGGFNQVSALTRERTGQTPTYQRTQADTDHAQARTGELLSQPLSADAALEIAFLNHRELQASFAELGISEAELVRAGRLRNPVFSFGRLREGDGVVETERSVMFDLIGLLTLPMARQIEQRRFEQVQHQAAGKAVQVAAEARQAFYGAVAAQELVRYYEQVKEAADASNELAQRMAQAGNINTLAQMREQSFYADAVADLARAQHRSVAERERLVRALGLSGPQLNFRLPERLPDLPPAATTPADAEQTALAHRLDVMAARQSVESTARSLGLTQATRFINVLELGYQNKSVTDTPRANGYAIELELPLFDFGSTRVARAEAIYMQAMHRAAQVALNAQSEVRESYSAYRSAYDLAKHYRDEVVPLKKRISEENLLRYNGMLISVFELLADAREQVRSVSAYVEALRDFWIADTQLKTAITAQSPASNALSTRPSTPATASAGGH